MRTTIATAVLLLSAGCTREAWRIPDTRGELLYATLSAEARRASADEKLVCEWARPTGTQIAERVCRTQREVEETRQATQRAWMLSPRAACPPGQTCDGRR
jgi:hypothetical protein